MRGLLTFANQLKDHAARSTTPADFGQQQAYLDVYWVYLGLLNDALSDSEARLVLEDMRDNLLIPWLQEDLLTLEWAWTESAALLSALLS